MDKQEEKEEGVAVEVGEWEGLVGVAEEGEEVEWVVDVVVFAIVVLMVEEVLEAEVMEDVPY